MRPLNRRDFLLLTGSFLAGWGALAYAARGDKRGLAQPTALEEEKPPWWPPPGPANAAPPIYQTYASGIILEVRPGELTVGNPMDGTQTLLLTPDTEYEENLWVKELPTEPGERVFASVTPAGPNRFRVEKIYVNQENLIGKVLDVQGGPRAPFTFTMTDRYDDRRTAAEKPHRVLIDPRTRVAQLPKLTPGINAGPTKMTELGNKPLVVEPGSLMQVIGRVKDGTLMAVTVLAMAES